MKTKSRSKRVLSLFIAVLMAVTAITPAFSAYAADGGVIDEQRIELFYKDSGEMVPDAGENGEAYIEYMTEGDELALTYKFVDGSYRPDNSYIKWYSETPTLVDVTQEGVVKAFDSSKGAVIHTWLDNEVRPIPLVGSIMAGVIEKALFNEYVNVDTMDTDAIVAIVEGLFGTDSPLDKYFESYKGEIVDSLRYYLDNINSNIHVQLYSQDDKLIADDFVKVVVQRNNEWYANFLPNGTHITNKSQINTTVAKGSTVQLYAVTTPVRLEYKTIYSVKNTSIFDGGKVVATVNDSGLVTFKNVGKVTIMVSPDTDQIIENILALVNYFYKLDNTGTIDTDKLAGILIDYVGIDMNRAVLAALLDTCFAIKDIAGDAADPVQLTATAVKVIANLVLQFVYNDEITFNVVESQPLTDFSIEGPTSVKEGTEIQMSIVNIKPEVGDVSDITWKSSNPEVASVDPKTGVILGRDAGGSLGALSSQKCTITATSAANNVSKSVEITVTGRTGKYLSDVEIVGNGDLQAGDETDFTYTVYPKRVAEADNLYIKWGILNGEDEEGNPVYIWATEETPATDGVGQLDSKGHYTAVGGGKCTIVVEAKTGYYVTPDRFYEISKFTATKVVTNGIPVESIDILVTDVALVGNIKNQKEVDINGQKAVYATISDIAAYHLNGPVVKATVYPEDATTKDVTWVTDNKNYDIKVSDDTHTLTATMKAGVERAESINIYAVSKDGRVKSNPLTVCLTKSFVKTNTINGDNIDVINGRQQDATHSVSFSGSSDAYFANYNANWYSSDEDVFTVAQKGDKNGNAVLTGRDVGIATLYCVSTDGGIVDTAQVTVHPDKEYLGEIVNLCDKTVVKRTDENKKLYKDYMKKLDLAYCALYDIDLVSQATCDTYAADLLYAFYKLGGFIGVAGVNILGTGKTQLESDYITVDVGAVSNYKNYSYEFDFELSPKNAMYRDVVWTSSSDKISVDRNGKCKPVDNDPCAGMITCTVRDYMGTETSDSVYIAFSRKRATGVTLSETNIVGGKIGQTKQITATVQPTGISGASNGAVHWETSDENVAKVDANGVVTFVRGGDCIITCTTLDGGFTATCAVNVVTNYDALQKLVTQYNDLGLVDTNYYPESFKVYQDAMAKAETMLSVGGYSQNEVDEMYNELKAAYDGLERYNYLQKVEIYLDGEEAKNFYQYNLSLLTDGLSYKNAILDMNVRLFPNNGSYSKVEWSSSTSDIAVTTEGQCSPTANKSCYGSVTCTVTDHYGNSFSDDVWVSFAYTPVTGVGISHDSIAGPVGSTFDLNHTVYPEGLSIPPHLGSASIQDVYWESDSTMIASVDQTGLVTFNSAGSTTVRVVSYDGGFSAECQVSSEGDRNALKAAIEKYKDIIYTDYEYNYGMEFKAAYDAAQEILTDKSASQHIIDTATNRLISAGEALAAHPYINVKTINVDWQSFKNSSPRESGTVDERNAVAIGFKDTGDYSSLQYNNTIVLTATLSPVNAMYDSIKWEVVSKSGPFEIEANGTRATAKISGIDPLAEARGVVKVTVTNAYGQTTERYISVTLAQHIVTGLTIPTEYYTIYATGAPLQLNAQLSSSNGNVNDIKYKDIIWTSNNNEVATVDQNGLVTPHECGLAVITATSVDGGYSDSAYITVKTDFSKLAAKHTEYNDLIYSVKDKYEYTEESLNVLAEAVRDAGEMINLGKATQAEVNAMIARLDEAHNSLVRYILVDSVSIGLGNNDAGVATPNEGFVRHAATYIGSKAINLRADCFPADANYKSIEWTSDNDKITVDERGYVTNNNNNAKYATITCTITNINDTVVTASINVAFTRNAVTAITFGDTVLHGAPGSVEVLKPEITYTDTAVLSSSYIKDCIYTSSNPEIAEVDNSGNVTFISNGSATITATTRDGGFTAQTVVYTTCDTTALKEALQTASAIDYMDYAYEYGMAFKSAYESAQAVYDNINCTQDEADRACTALTLATSELTGHEFIVPEPTLNVNGAALTDGAALEVNENSQIVVDAVFNDGAMVKSVEWITEDETGVAASANGNALTVTKTEAEGTLRINLIVTDDYDRETIKTVTIKLVDKIVPVTSIALTADGAPVTGDITISCAGDYANFAGMTIGYILNPENANTVAGVSFKTTNPLGAIKVDAETGAVTLSNPSKYVPSYNNTVVCSVTNSDGTVVTASVKITITKA